MHIEQNKPHWVRIAGLDLCGSAVFAAIIALAGCASPGPPLPPTLNLPQIVSGTALTATRIGDEVRLHWTTPTQSTDKLPIKGQVTAEICRQTGTSAKGTGTKPCKAVTRVEVTAGASDAVDKLPSTLTTGPARMLSYRVQLLNASGRTAGPSPAAFAVAGQALRPVQGFTGHSIRAGVLLHWSAANGAGRVELDRTVLDPANGAGTAAERKSGLPGRQKQAAEARFSASADIGDAGGTVDRTVEMGHSYSYTAQRVEAVELGGRALELRSVPTAELTFAVRDEFPPDVPSGLVAVPGLAGEGEAQKPTIDLSWESNVDARVAGYRVYRREMGANNSGEWARLGSQLVTTAAYRDLTVVAGHRYSYRVTAVSTSGNESVPSGEAVESAPGQ